LKRKPVFFITAIFTALIFLSALALPVNRSAGVKPVIEGMKAKAAIFAKACDDLQLAVQQLIPSDSVSVQNAKRALINCRYQYKQTEFFLEYFFIRSARVFNGPPKFELEEPESGYPEPVGFQQMEAILYAKDSYPKKHKLIEQAALVCNSARELPVLLEGFETSDRQLLQSLKQELIRVMTLGITGYDAPLLKSGITESCYALRSIQTALFPWLQKKPSAALSNLLTSSIAYLKANPGFDRFDRMRFLTRYALPLQEQLNLYICRAGLQLDAKGVFNEQAKNLFSRNAFNQNAFDDQIVNTRQVVALGKALFAERGLSGPGNRSCATCHQPNRYFTDGLPKSMAIDGHAHVLRNAPTLLYAGFQHSQFLDGRVKSLIDQVKEVLASKEEMAGSPAVIETRLSQNKQYLSLFKKAFPGNRDVVSLDNTAAALAAYTASLSPRNSAFDRYMAGGKKALTSSQIKGFNLFMGKAQCGTCHFAPLFNGLIPPLYQTSELEILGVPETDDKKNVKADPDDGRYRTMPVSFFKGAFKTPTVMNIAKTGPYMHNGAFHTLDQVLDFYNGGGGNGWGLDNKEQTLSSDSLKLNKYEVKAIISFLNSLTDQAVR
jgi:cytochrome c peroxidase